MKWYYVEQGQQAGPVDDAQLDEMRRIGRIQADTLVWREGLANWMPYAEAKGESGAATAPPPQAFPAGNPGGDPVEAVCSECGRIFPKNNMIRHREAYVCAGCKPVFMQKLAEGAKLNTGALNYAGFWIRFVARFLDIVITLVATWGLISLLSFVFIGIGAARGNEPGILEAILGLFILCVWICGPLAYFVFFLGKYGATPGKMICRIMVTKADGCKITYLHAFGRCFAEMLSGMICYIGYIIAAFDDQKRALHDHICSTRVVYKD